MIIAFEGMDGCGKSSVAKSVASNLNFRYEPQKMISLLNISPEQYDSLVKEVRKSNNKNLSFVFYVFKCMLDKQIANNTIIERTMISTYYFERNNVDERYFDEVMKENIIPDLTFLLYASSSTRCQRIYKRNHEDEDLHSSEALYDGYPIMIDFMKKYNIPCIIINTERYSLSQVIEICTLISNEYQKLTCDDDKTKLINEANKKYGIRDLDLEKEKTYEKRI